MSCGARAGTTADGVAGVGAAGGVGIAGVGPAGGRRRRGLKPPAGTTGRRLKPARMHHFLSAAPPRSRASHRRLARSEGEGLSCGRRDVPCSGARAWPSTYLATRASGTRPRRRTSHRSRGLHSPREAGCGACRGHGQPRWAAPTQPVGWGRGWCMPKARADTQVCPYEWLRARIGAGARRGHGRDKSRPRHKPAGTSPRRRTLCCCCREFTRPGPAPALSAAASPSRWSG